MNDTRPNPNETALEYLDRVWGESIEDLDPLTESDIRRNADEGYRLDQELVAMLDTMDRPAVTRASLYPKGMRNHA